MGLLCSKAAEHIEFASDVLSEELLRQQCDAAEFRLVISTAKERRRVQVIPLTDGCQLKFSCADKKFSLKSRKLSHKEAATLVRTYFESPQNFAAQTLGLVCTPEPGQVTVLRLEMSFR